MIARVFNTVDPILRKKERKRKLVVLRFFLAFHSICHIKLKFCFQKNMLSCGCPCPMVPGGPGAPQLWEAEPLNHFHKN